MEKLPVFHDTCPNQSFSCLRKNDETPHAVSASTNMPPLRYSSTWVLLMITAETKAVSCIVANSRNANQIAPLSTPLISALTAAIRRPLRTPRIKKSTAQTIITHSEP